MKKRRRKNTINIIMNYVVVYDNDNDNDSVHTPQFFIRIWPDR